MKKILFALALLFSTPALGQSISPIGPNPPCTSFGTASGTCIQGAGAAGTPSSITLSNGTGLPISTGVSGLGTGVATLLSGTSSGTGGPMGTASPTTTGTLTGANITISGSMHLSSGGGVYYLNGDESSISFNGSSQVQVQNNTLGVGLGINATSWSAISLHSRKKDFTPLTDPLTRIMGLRAELGRYKEDSESLPLRPFLYVEDAMKVYPWAVEYDGDKPTGLRYTDTIPLIIAGEKELIWQIRVLFALVATLFAGGLFSIWQIIRLRSRLTDLESSKEIKNA